MPEATENSEPSWFGFPITIKKDSSVDREDLIKFLNANKIGTRLLFAGNITKQPYMKNVKFKIHNNLNNSDIIMEKTFWIGVYPGLTPEHLNYVYDIFKSYFSKL